MARHTDRGRLHHRNKDFMRYQHDSYWEDLRFPASAISDTASPSREADTGLFLFKPSEKKDVAVSCQLPHAWDEGTVLKPHVHWQKTTSAIGDVTWQLDYKWSPINEVMDADWTTIQVSTTAFTDANTANHHLITSFGELDAANRQISDMLLLKISRDGVAVEDTYGGDARLLEFDVHYKRHIWSSETEYDVERPE